VAPITLNPEVPAELERILNKALEKDREVRYQVAAELRADLKRLQRELDSGKSMAVSSASTRVAVSQAGVARAAAEPSRPAISSSAKIFIAASTKNKFGTGVALTVVVLLLAAAAFGVYSLLPHKKELPVERMSIENLTNSGNVFLTRISPDGKYLLHVRQENGLQSLWLRHIPTAATRKWSHLLPPATPA